MAQPNLIFNHYDHKAITLFRVTIKLLFWFIYGLNTRLLIQDWDIRYKMKAYLQGLYFEYLNIEYFLANFCVTFRWSLINSCQAEMLFKSQMIISEWSSASYPLSNSFGPLIWFNVTTFTNNILNVLRKCFCLKLQKWARSNRMKESYRT